MLVLFSAGQNRSTENLDDNFFVKFLKILILKLILKKNLHFLSILDNFQSITKNGFEKLSSRAGGGGLYPNLRGSTTKYFMCVFPSMKAQLKLRLSLFFYLCLLLIKPRGYILYAIVVHVLATITAASASIAFIVFLLFRKPAERNILNKQILMLFYIKLANYPYYSGLMYYFMNISHSQLQSTKEDWELMLFSFSSARIMIILNLLMYTLVSASRTLLFISPAKFNYLNKKLVMYCSILTLVLVFVFEIVMSQVVFSPTRCEVDARGNKIHALPAIGNSGANFNMSSPTDAKFTGNEFNETSKELPDFISSEAKEKNVNETSLEFPGTTCTLFPSIRILIIMFLVLESIRFILAVSRKYKMIKTQSQKIVPMQFNALQSIGLQPRRIINEDVSFKHTGSMPGANVIENIEDRRLSLPILPGSIIESLGQSRPSGSVPKFNVPKKIEERRFGLQSLPGQISDSPGLNEPEPSRNFGSVPNFNVPDIIGERRLSLQILPQNIIKSPAPLNEPEILVVNTHQEHTAQTLSDVDKMKNYVLFLILRTYTLVIVMMVIYMVYFILPIHIFSWLEISVEFNIIDIYFVPVFWILYEKEAWNYTVKNANKVYLSVVLRFSRE